jgi:hypothetical protein
MIANYGILNKSFILTTGGATAIAEDSLFKVKTAAAVANTATLLSLHQITYRTGQGAAASFTAKFTPGVAGSEQLAGLIAATDGFGFGYDGDSFGILHAHDGKIECQELTVTTPAAAGENATVTVNGVPYTVPLTGGGTTVDDTIEIAASLNAQVPAYDFTANDSQVVAASILAGPQGAFAFSSATAVAAWVQIVAGVDVTNEWTPIADWNQYIPPDLDPSKGNVYRIQYQYLGFGGIEFSVENPKTADFDLVHRIEYANAHDLPSVTNPTFRIGWAATNITNDTEIEVAGASAAGFVEGIINRDEDPRAIRAEIATLGQTLTSMIVIRNRIVINDQRNRSETFPLKVSAFIESAKLGDIEIRKHTELPGGGPFEFAYLDKDKSTTEVSTNQFLITGGQIIDAIPVGIQGDVINLAELGIELLPNEYLSVSMKQRGTPAEPASAVLTIREDL